MTAHETTLSDLRAGRLHGATRLDLRHSGLTEFPPEIFALADTLQMLDLSGNALSELPDDLHRLHQLRILFCSSNRFTVLPPALGRCAPLDIVGFKANQIEQVPAQAIPNTLRWLILTDNRIAELPDTVGRCARLQKLMLAGNRLTALPAKLGDCRQLELLRLSANRFETARDALPDWLLALPRLAWLAYAGNPFNADAEANAAARHPIARIGWDSLRLGALLGEGASGLIHAAAWQPAGAPAQPVAIKLFKGEVTSDGLPRSEMAACIAVGSHACLVGVEGQLTGHPQGMQGLVMRLIPAGYRNLAGPPSFASCTRDVYDPALRFGADEARTLAHGVASALAHLHERGVTHGDLYAHNVLVDDRASPLLGDFGAGAFLPEDDAVRAEALRRIDRRALAVLVDEVAVRCEDPHALDDLRAAIEV